MNKVKITKRTAHTASKLSCLPKSKEVERQFEMLRSEVFTKGLDIVQAHRASGLCIVTYEDWDKCCQWYKDLCDRDWTAFQRVPKVVYKHLPNRLKAKVKVEGLENG